MMYWYAIHSKTRKEDFVCAQLQTRGVEIFYPRIRVQPVNPRARKIKPYFPGYIFGHIDLDQVGKSFLEWIPGAIGIISFGGEPTPVSDHLITTLRNHLDLVNAERRPKPELFQQGDLIKIHGGVFDGYEAIFDTHLPGRERVEVFLNLLKGHQLRLKIPVEQIAPKKTGSN